MISREEGERIGEFLVGIGALSPEQVRIVLDHQMREPGKLFGEIALERGFIDDEALEAYLRRKMKREPG